MSKVPSEPTAPEQCPNVETPDSPTAPDPIGSPSAAFPRAEAEQSLDRADAFLLRVSDLGQITGP